MDTLLYCYFLLVAYFACFCLSISSLLLTLDSIPVTTVSMGLEPGTWIAKLPATSSSDAKHNITISDGHNNSVHLDDILFGDVWICSGQSNSA